MSNWTKKMQLRCSKQPAVTTSLSCDCSVWLFWKKTSRSQTQHSASRCKCLIFICHLCSGRWKSFKSLEAFLAYYAGNLPMLLNHPQFFKWKRINRKQSTRWQHLSRLKANAFFSLQFFSCYETQQFILGTGTAIWWVTEPH